MKYTTPIVAVLSVVLLAGTCIAEPPGRQRGERAKGANGQRRASEGQRPGGGAERDPKQMVARMMKEFDKDGDSKLNAAELTAMLTSMRDRRGSGERPGGASGRKPGAGPQQKGPEKNGQKPGENRKRGQNGNGKPAKAGGQTPKRPASE
ncbi:MAG: EF-hand domain-containing protein [Fuerstiella sp.]|nr:EF-hand domain-containing protein [Fuerstiella sp.]